MIANYNNSSSSYSNSKLATLALLEVERRRRAVPPLTFRGSAEIAQTITDREWILGGPSETGKTFATMYLLHRMLCQHANAKATILRKVRASLHGTALNTWERVIQLGEMKPRQIGGVWPSMYVYPNGSVVYIGGLDNAQKILSGERDYIYVNQAEELSGNDWETLTTRTTGRGSVVPHPMLFGDCNPSHPEHWILQRAEAGSLQLLRSYHTDNPSLHDGNDWTEQGRRTIQTLQSLTGPRYSRLYLGDWVADDGDEAFLPSIAMYDNCADDIPRAKNTQPMVVGLDAAISGDTFAMVAVSRHPDVEQNIILRHVQVWKPNGEALDFVQIERDIRAFLDQYNVVQIAYDPYQLHYFAQRLADVVWCESFNQGSPRLEADATLRTLIVQRRFHHDGTFGVLREHIASADAKIDETGHRLRMVKRFANQKIDAAVACSMACYRALELNLY